MFHQALSGNGGLIHETMIRTGLILICAYQQNKIRFLHVFSILKCKNNTSECFGTICEWMCTDFDYGLRQVQGQERDNKSQMKLGKYKIKISVLHHGYLLDITARYNAKLT